MSRKNFLNLDRVRFFLFDLKLLFQIMFVFTLKKRKDSLECTFFSFPPVRWGALKMEAENFLLAMKMKYNDIVLHRQEIKKK